MACRITEKFRRSNYVNIFVLFHLRNFAERFTSHLTSVHYVDSHGNNHDIFL